MIHQPINKLHAPLKASFSRTPLGVGMLVYVVSDSNLPNALFDHPDMLDDNLCGWLRTGEIVQILDGPHFRRSMTFWYVRSLHSKLVGWTSAGSVGERFLMALPLRSLCEYSLPTRLQIGYTVAVAGAKQLPITLLRTPRFAPVGSNILDTLFPGTQMVVSNGPVCAGAEGHGRTFWEVRLEDGANGWVAECSHQTYWLEPTFVP